MTTATPIKIGDLFTDYVQPYGTRTIRVDRIDVSGKPSRYECGPQMTMTLHGTVVEGVEVGRLFQHTTTRDITGRRHIVYGVGTQHWAAREKVTAICG